MSVWKKEHGEYNIGDLFQRSFHKANFSNSLVSGLVGAGASSVLASAWPLAGEAATDFVSKFYSKLRQGQSVMESYADSQLELMCQQGNSMARVHPALWGAFTLWRSTDLTWVN